MDKQLRTRYLLESGTCRMNILLDQVIPRGSYVTLKDDKELGPDAGKTWFVVERYETLETAQIKKFTHRSWNNNI